MSNIDFIQEHRIAGEHNCDICLRARWHKRAKEQLNAINEVFQEEGISTALHSQVIAMLDWYWATVEELHTQEESRRIDMAYSESLDKINLNFGVWEVTCVNPVTGKRVTYVTTICASGNGVYSDTDGRRYVPYVVNEPFEHQLQLTALHNPQVYVVVGAQGSVLRLLSAQKID